MRLATFSQGSSAAEGAAVARVGLVDGDEIVDLGEHASALPSDACAHDMASFLAAGAPALEAAGSALSSGKGRRSLVEVELQAPVPRPPEFLAVGLNYADHIEETGRPKPEFPVIFNKQISCVTGPGKPVHLPRASYRLDYEGELAFVIGRRCRHVPRERAPEVIAGYTICNDVSVRDWQARAPTMTLGKSWDTHGPIGPTIVTADEVGDPHALDLRTWVNGEERQNSNTRHLIFDCFELVETLSTVFTLEPGTVITTGTPSGVAVGSKPYRWLKVGDRVRIEISGLGALENEVIAEPEDSALL